MAESGVRVATGAVATITIDRADVANCLSRTTLDELAAAVTTVRDDPGVRAAIVTGAGEKAFCAGADLKERGGMTDEGVREYIRTIRDVITAIERLPCPVIAAINGVALGGGCEIALACDIRVMSEAAQIGLTETSLGIIPGGGGTQRLPRLVGRGRALELILTARRVEATEAVRIGLVHETAAPGEVRARAGAVADRIAANAPLAIRAAKEAVLRGADLPLDEALALETVQYERTLATKDRVEGFTAFREKRAPIYRGE